MFFSLWTYISFPTEVFQKAELENPLDLYSYTGYINIDRGVYIYIYICTSIQYNILLCIIIKISTLKPGAQDKIIPISVQKIFGRFIGFFVSDSPPITFMLLLLCLVLLLLQTNSKKQARKSSVLSFYFYEDDRLNACSGTLLISTHINKIKQIT